MGMADRFRTSKILASQAGISGVAVIISLFALGAVLGTLFTAGKVLEQNKVLQNENLASLSTEVMISRVTQAVAGNAVKCSGVTKKCEWNENIEFDQFGFSKVKVEGDRLRVEGDVCLNALSVTTDKCHKHPMAAVVSISDVRALMNAGLITGERKPGDEDGFAVIVESEASYVKAGASGSRDLATEGPTSSTKKVDHTGTLKRASAIRRPRAFLKIESDPGFCTVGCAPPTGNNPAPPCYSPPQFTGDTTQAGVVNVRIINDGPGYIYAFKIRREFTPNPYFGIPAASLTPTYGNMKDGSTDTIFQIYSGEEQGFTGLAPGETFSFSDQLPCFTEVTTTTVTGPGTTTVSVTQSTQKTGDVVYTFEPLSLDPDNMLILGRSGQAIPAALQETTTYDGGGGGGGDGGGDGDGCDGGGGGCDGV